VVKGTRKRGLSRQDLRELGAAPRVQRTIAPDGRQRVEIPEEHKRKEGFGRRAR
jgi:hypothetical protein